MSFLSENTALISLIALIVAVVLTVWRDKNLGTLAIALTFIIGYFIAGISEDDLISSYPTDLFIMLAGVTFFFGVAQSNGTMDKMVKYAIRMVRGNVALLPIVLFFAAFIVSSIGPGQINTSAMFAAPVMLLASEVGIPPLLMALVVGNGAQAGAMSPLSPNGVVGYGVLADMGYSGWEITIWVQMLVAHIIVGAVAYIICGGLKLWGKKSSGEVNLSALKNIQVEPFTGKQIASLVCILIMIICVVGFKLHIGLVGFVLGSVLLMFDVADERQVFKSMPWNSIMLVTGVSCLVDLMEDIGGIDLFADIIATISTPFTFLLVVGFISGIVSAYTSTSGFIMPAFLPMAPLLLENLGLGIEELLPLAVTIVVAGHLTDMSPLSTTGAVFIGGAPDTVERKPLYRGMIIWGLSMSVFGAALCWLLYGIIGIL